ncbi:TonB-dependent receptor [Chryseobacterium polytrichastri]|uniref:TonB-linked outer membrane protein, SusC/RagA family n=1 Tax=Chryseobacterium polytrichastri TaxID=1302687 RepID=A0A1M7DR65_9FLAO|nr:TonB-dependent receptor [Chryseobacterium polytrichastri]SHL81649.1 TonB-linked outer membrane protein, SusC/RagA family [Chryseobacterium polytrichastri]
MHLTASFIKFYKSALTPTPRVKFTIILLLCCLQLSMVSYSQTITINANKADITQIFKEIESQSGYQFFYKYRDIANAHPVTINLKNASLEETLAKSFLDQPFTYKVLDKIIVVSRIKIASPDPNTNHAAKVTGLVKDESGQPLPGVSIRIKGSSGGTITDRDGMFTISADPKALLDISYIGYKTIEETIANRALINIILEQDNQELDEVVVVGYGNLERRNLTSSVGAVKMSAINGIKKASLDLQLAGQLAGVSVNQVTGTPGGGVVVRVRGSASTGAGDDPMYVIDGFPITPSFDQNSNPISNLNPDDIESISVLKDAASTAIYGSRGANGVILINTKKAKIGQSSITLNTFTGIQSILAKSKIKMMDATQFAQFRVEAAEDLAKFNGTVFDPATIPAEYKNPSSLGKGTNWYNEITRPALMQNYSLTVANGTTKVRSLFTVGYFNQQGNILNTDFKRYSLRANIEADIVKNVVIGLNLAPSYITRNVQGTDGHFENGVLTQALLDSPIPPVRLPDGSYNTRIGSAGTFINNNPVNSVMNTINKQSGFRTLANVYASWQFLNDFNIKTTFGADYGNSNTDTFKPSFVGGFRFPPPQLASGSTAAYNSLNWLSENTVNYNHKWGAHSLAILGGFSVQNEVSNGRSAFGTGFPDDVVPTLNAATNITATAAKEAWKLLSFFSRVNYAYEDKYLLAASLRRDGSSRFAPTHRWGTFPSVSAGWRISNESFFPKTTWIDQLKFTASYGLAGNNNIGNYAYIPTVDKNNYVFGDVLAPGSGLSQLGNSNLGWETTHQLNMGMDLSMLKGRIYLVAEYYNRYTQDMLSDISLPVSSGFYSTLTNVGNVRNRGFEFTLTTKNMNRKDFNWETSFNISFNRNKVLSLGNTLKIAAAPVFENATSITEVGHPLGMFYGYVFDGIFNNQHEIDTSPHFDGQVPGTIKYKDINGDGVIDEKDQTIIGSPYPNFTFGLNNHLSYKNFDLNIVMAGSQGGHVFDLYKQFTTNLDGVFNVEQEVANRWRSEANPGAGLLPTTNANTNLARDLYPSYWVKSNSYIAFKDITIGYSFKTKFSRNFRVYLSAQNALLITGYKGGNPEVAMDSETGNHSLSPGINFISYPVSAVYAMGINLTL